MLLCAPDWENSSGWITGKTYSVAKYWNRLLREVMNSWSLEVFKKCGDVSLRDVARDGLMAGQIISEAFFNLNDSVVLQRSTTSFGCSAL